MSFKEEVYYYYDSIPKDNQYHCMWDENFHRIEQVNLYRHETSSKHNPDIPKKIQKYNDVQYINDQCFFFISDFDYNFFHILNDLVGLFHYFKGVRRRHNKNIKLVIRETSNTVYDYLKCLDIEDKKIIKIKGNQLYKFRSVYCLEGSGVVKRLFKYMIETNSLLRTPSQIKTYEKLFLYRTNNKRINQNINSLVKIALKHGFYVYSPELDTFDNQLRLIQNCKYLLCELGAGCANYYFTQEDCKIIIIDFLDYWCNRFIRQNENFFNREIHRLEGILIEGNEHNCTWTFDELKLDDELSVILDQN